MPVPFLFYFFSPGPSRSSHLTYAADFNALREEGKRDGLTIKMDSLERGIFFSCKQPDRCQRIIVHSRGLLRLTIPGRRRGKSRTVTTPIHIYSAIIPTVSPGTYSPKPWPW